MSDEVDVVAANVERHIAHGADAVIVTDDGSIDGTVDVLRDYERSGVVRLIHEPGDDYLQSQWVTDMARLAALDFGADWVLNADADEFWRPVDDTVSLAEALASLPADRGSLLARRVKLVAPPGESVRWPDRLVFRDVLSLGERGTLWPEALPSWVERRGRGIWKSRGRWRGVGFNAGQRHRRDPARAHEELFPVRTEDRERWQQHCAQS